MLFRNYLMNREQWLTELSIKMDEQLFRRSYKLGQYRVTCGWPSSGGTGTRSIVLGQCFAPTVSKNKIHELFISPIMDDPLKVAGVLCHEMVHIAAGVDAKHGKLFVKVAQYIGMTSGKPKSLMPGDRLNEILSKIIEPLGEYPHGAMVLPIKPKKPSSMVSIVCSECGCRATMSKKWVREAGTPTCGCGTLMTPS